MMRPLVPLVFTLAALAGLTACGADPVGAPDRQITKTIVSVPSNPALGDLARNQLGGSTYDDGQGAALLQQARVQLANQPGFEAEIVSRTWGSFRAGALLKAPREVRMRYRMAWAPPTRFATIVMESSENDFAGARVGTDDGAAYRARVPGLLGLVTRKLTPDDPRLMNARGHKIGDLAPHAQFSRLMGPNAFWTVIGSGTTPAGDATVRVAVAGVPRLDPETDREEVEFVRGTFALYQVASYVGNRRAVSYDFVSFKLGAPAAEAFPI